MSTTSVPPQLATRVIELGNVTGAVTIDASLGNEFNMSVTGNITLTITNASPGSLLLNFTQANGGSHTVSLGSQVLYSTSIASFTASTTAGLVDTVGLRYAAAPGKYRLLAVSQGATA